MDRIKFRLWLKNYETEKGTMYYNCLPIGGWNNWWVALDEDQPNAYDGEFEVGKDCEVMRSTGLKDMWKNERYEGDIIRRITGYVFVEEKKFFRLGDKNCAMCYGYDYHPDDEIIGNIYQNPDLL